MLMNLYSFYDTKAKSFSQPFVCSSHAEAQRGFYALCADPQTKFSIYPEDYELYSLGTLCDQSGDLRSISPEKLLSALSAKSEIISRIKESERIANLARSISNTTAEVLPQGQAEGASEPIPTLQDMINFTANTGAN